MRIKKLLSLFMILGLLVSVVGCSTNDIKNEDIVENKLVDEEKKKEEKRNREIDLKVKDLMSKMTVEEKIGQLFMIDFRTWNGQNFTKMNQEVSKVISDFKLGGIILFAENIESAEQTTRLCAELQNSISNKEIPLFIGIDQEGGIVSRLSMGTNLSGNMSVGASASKDIAYEYGKILGEELKALGININFAPSFDVNSNPSNPVIGTRAISSSPSLVSSIGIEIVRGMGENNIIAGVKHFPGHGDTKIDSHIGLPRVDKTREELEGLEFVPFRENIKNLDIVMTAHIQYPQIEKDKNDDVYLPATLSDDLITGVLRNDMDFDGVVITDAMNMGAISDNFNNVESIKIAINAGVDIILMPTTLASTKDITKFENIINNLVSSVESNEISVERLNKSVERILKLKYKKELLNFDDLPLEDRIINANKVVSSKEHRDKERMIAASGITVLENDNVIPLKVKENEKILLIASSEGRLNSMRFGIDRLILENKIPKLEINTYSYKNQINIDRVLEEKLNKADKIIILTESHGISQLRKGYYLREFPRKVLDYSKVNDKETIFVSVANPYNVGFYKDAKAQLLTYGSSGMDVTENLKEMPKSYSPNIPAAMDIIFGAYSASGKLPIDIPKVNDDGSMNSSILEYKIGDGIIIKN